MPLTDTDRVPRFPASLVTTFARRGAVRLTDDLETAISLGFEVRCAVTWDEAKDVLVLSQGPGDYSAYQVPSGDPSGGYGICLEQVQTGERIAL